MDMAEAGEVESWPYALKHMVRRFTHVRVRVKGFGVYRDFYSLIYVGLYGFYGDLAFFHRVLPTKLIRSYEGLRCSIRV